MPHYQVSRCNQAGLRLLLLIVLTLATWQLLSPQPLEQVSSVNDKLGHALLFLLLATLTDHAFSDKLFNWRKVIWLTLYGISIECLQHFIPQRSFDLLDIGADVSGIFTYWLFIRFIFVREIAPPAISTPIRFENRKNHTKT